LSVLFTEYTWTVPHDMETLIRLSGGPSTTEARLDAMFVVGLKGSGVGEGQTNGVGSTLFNPGRFRRMPFGTILIQRD
jgi:hypothetical protein